MTRIVYLHSGHRKLGLHANEIRIHNGRCRKVVEGPGIFTGRPKFA
ncbi:MAG: hypothetical protein H7246_23475 [Phycisphaerae bacterium]|nr:hypothetical protein [Saprospiraceae bacterium]